MTRPKLTERERLQIVYDYQNRRTERRRRERAASGGFLYFIRRGRFVKIGHTGYVEGRLASLQTASPLPLTLLVAFSGCSDQDERDAHLHFKEYRERGEWFRLEGRLAKAMAPYIAETP